MLNIKNPRAHELAAEVAQVAGETLTDAVIHALEERRDRLKAQPRRIDLAKVQSLLQDIRSVAPPAFFEAEDATAFLYDDETGLPK